MFKIKEIVKNANEATAEILKDKDLNVTEINNLYLCSSNGHYRRSKWNRI